MIIHNCIIFYEGILPIYILCLILIFRAGIPGIPVLVIGSNHFYSMYVKVVIAHISYFNFLKLIYSRNIMLVGTRNQINIVQLQP